MFKKRLLPVYGFIIFLANSCGSSQPARTNVLNRPPATNVPATQPPNQTVFNKPPQQTAPPVTPVYTPPPVEKDDDEAPATVSPQSKAYYGQRERELQYGAKQTYYRLLDSINRQISLLPSNNSRKPDVNQPEWHATTNFNMRKPNYVIIHHTAQTTVEQTLYTFCVPRAQVSAHYVISRDGVVYQMLNDYLRAWHAGNSRWGSITDINSFSIGIELDNTGTEPFSNAQITALIKVLDRLKEDYGIPQANFIGHSDIAPGRKNDPSRFFPWKKLADAGFGYWYDANNLKTPPYDFNPMMALRIIGYDTRNPTTAIASFKLHFIQNDKSATLSDYDKTVLYNVYLKYQ